MNVVTAFPRRVRTIEHCWIPMPDGCRLAARIWLPEDAPTSPVPAVLEYIPYRKRDFTRVRDEPIHHYFAGHGYAAVRVDVRGTGDSDGLLADEYSEQELADGEAVVAWLANQPWCTGAVGMMGKSWGGFNALQVAARRPPALRAIIAVCASDDRWADDAHYMGGCLLNENLTWGAVLLATVALPPDPDVVGDAWRDAWLARIDQGVLFPETWLRHQRRDAYWRRGSVGDDLGRIACPVYAVGGWADAYTDAIPRLLAGLTVPRKGLVGPWAHVYPHAGVPGPAIGFLQEAVRWWDRWLKGADPGVTDEPCYRAWLGGRWVGETSWPSPRIVARRWALNPGRLDETPGAEVALELCSPQSVGLAAGEWCRFGGEGDGPSDQADDDARSLTFDSAPLGEGIEILGAPVAVLELAVDRPQAVLAVRLNEVRPDGSSARVTYGVLRVAGGRRRVRVALRQVGHAFAAGSRLRLAVSTAYWPVVWPAPEAVTATVYAGTSALELPVRPPSSEDRLSPFSAPEAAPRPAYTELRPPRAVRTTARDGDEIVHTIATEAGPFRAGGPGRLDAIGLEVEESSRRTYRIRDDDPLSARAEVVHRMALRRDGWDVAVECHASLAATPDHFELRARLDAWEGGHRVRSRTWEQRIARDVP